MTIVVLYYRRNCRVELPNEDNYTIMGPLVSHPASLTGIQNSPSFYMFLHRLGMLGRGED